jgi:hypothetical protein
VLFRSFDVIACKDLKVGDNGCIEVWVADGMPVVLFDKEGLKGSTLCDIEGESDVALESVYIQSTTVTSEVDGQLTVMHSATTMPLLVHIEARQTYIAGSSCFAR